MSNARIIRQRIWERLKAVARPDTRFHLDFSSFIPDFEGSEAATARVTELPAFRESRLAFVTPDNSLTGLRRRMIEAGMPFVMSSYNIRRGFLYLAPGAVPPGIAEAAAWLDGMEHYARPVSLQEIAALGRFDFIATGASAVSVDGVRFGRGHAFFDLEWGIFTDLGLVEDRTPVVAVVHDVQVVEDRLQVAETDIPADIVATPSRLISVGRAHRRPRGLRWETVSAEDIDAIPPLKELARLRGIA